MTESQKPTVFIGSTNERADIADAMIQHLKNSSEVTHWQDAFPPGFTIYETLMSLKDQFDFSVFVLTADDFIKIRDDNYQVPRDNVIFELGLFLGSIGTGRVFAVIDESIQTKLPTDLTGVIYETYNSNRKDKNIISALRPACIRIREQISMRGARPYMFKNREDHIKKNLIGIDKVYNSYIESEPDISLSFRNTDGPVKLLLYVASQNVGIKGPILDLIDEASKKGISVKILHADINSPVFSKARLERLGKDYNRIKSTIEYISLEMDKIQERQNNVLRRGHNIPFVWRIYAFPEHLYIMPYYSSKDAAVKSPVFRFINDNHSMYGSYIELFEYLWGHLSPRVVNISELISTSTSTGTALITNWNGRHVFGVPRRDIANESGQLRFYGLGGKREKYDETLADCALREGNEETNGAVANLLSSQTTKLLKYDGSIEDIELHGDNINPVLIAEKQRFLGVKNKAEQIPDQLIYTFCYYAELKQKPCPSREIAAIILMDDEHLKLFKRMPYTTLSDLLLMGIELIEAVDVSLDREAIMIPHGTANFLLHQ